MVRKLPPLNALKAFEAAARHQSLTKAAAELNVSHAAISRHIRDLEKNLRAPLFERTGRGVELTEAGAALVAELTKAFDILAAATSPYLRSSRKRQRLVITSDVPFATMWLVPKLGRFTSGHPGFDITVDPAQRLVDFAKEDVDLGIRFGRGDWRGTSAEKLADAELTVVCSPKLLQRFETKSPSDLPANALIQEQDRAHWQAWLDAAGVRGKIVPGGPTLLADLTMIAAEAGQGFALVDRVLAYEALKSGRLIAPFNTIVRTFGYYLVSRGDAPLSKPAAAFRRWIKAEMDRTVAGLAGLSSRQPGKAYRTAAPAGEKRTRKPPTT